MNAPQRIVVGLDLDPKSCRPTAGSLAAAETALWLAPATKAHVTLLHSIARDEYFDALTNELVPVCDTVSPEARLAIAELVSRFHAAGSACETIDTSERAPLAIEREVQRQHADLVLLGKHDGRESDATRIGPIAVAVLRNCPSAVWTVVPGRTPTPRRILAATDLTSVGEKVVTWAATLAEFARAELHVVHVHPPALHTRGNTSNAHRERLMEAMRAGLSAPQREHAQLHLRDAAAAPGVLDTVEQIEPDLVVLGAFSHKREPGKFVGTTTERLFAHLQTGLLVLKPE